MDTPPEADLKRRKAALREISRAARSALTPEQRRACSAAVAARALDLPELSRATAVLAYGATPEELDCEPLLERLRELGARVAFPRVAGPGELDIHWVGGIEECRPGAFGILEPTPDCARAELAEMDLVLVPGVAFDRKGDRLGYGGGFYDRLLGGLASGVPTIGLAFDEQVFDEVPSSAHDVRVGIVVTPSAVYPIRLGNSEM